MSGGCEIRRAVRYDDSVMSLPRVSSSPLSVADKQTSCQPAVSHLGAPPPLRGSAPPAALSARQFRAGTFDGTTAQQRRELYLCPTTPAHGRPSPAADSRARQHSAGDWRNWRVLNESSNSLQSFSRHVHLQLSLERKVRKKQRRIFFFFFFHFCRSNFKSCLSEDYKMGGLNVTGCPDSGRRRRRGFYWEGEEI